ncbi:MAG TPA: CinA family nicotinamide mononucleotide deamidase-related protein [Candidatus Saccharimonadales bacterium]|nr:CinA family nicotinamide mononucleotide deamidase-related protein [Candidatus Saccharimonadales bacterium]
MRAELLSIGTELLLGQITDTNSAYLAGRLAGLGIDLLHLSTVGDNLVRATEAFRLGIERSDLIVTTGGLGPTEDDLTREAIAAALGETPAVDLSLERDLADWFAGRGTAMPERNRKQAWLIPSARAVPNPHGTAPGWDVRVAQGAGGRGTRIISMPGVPREMIRMWEDQVEPTLLAGTVLRSRTLKFLGVGESAVEEALDELVRSTAPTVATYAKNDGVHVRITDKGTAAAAVEARIGAMERVIRERIGGQIWGADDDTLGGVIGAALRAHGWRLVVAESLTGGEVGRTLSETQGSGEWLAAAVTLPAADAEALTAAAGLFPANVRLLIPDGAGECTLTVETPGRAERRSTVRFRSVVEGRRRATLAGLDLLRRAVGGIPEDPV